MALQPLNTARPYIQYTRPGVGTQPSAQEGAGYIAGPHAGSYANTYAQPMNVGAIYVFTDGNAPQVAFAGITQSGVTYMRGLDFCNQYLAPYGIKTLAAGYQASIAQLGAFSSSNATGQAPGWSWSVTTGGGS